MPLNTTFCSRCDNYMLGDVRDHKNRLLAHNQKKHHDTLAELKACAESKTVSPCPLCCLLWVSAQESISEARMDQLLINWPLNRVLVLHEEPDSLGDQWTAYLCLSTGLPREHAIKESLCNLHISAEAGSPAAHEIRGRFSEIGYLAHQTTSDSEHELLWVKTQLNQCCGSHERCGRKKPMPLPDKIVNIEDASTWRLVETQKGEKARYVALSYCWGKKINGEHVHKVDLRTHNIDDMKKQIDQSKMTRTHREAIEVARQLGYKYIWIDALCIIQDSIQDWERAAHGVPHIYGNAELTVVAGRSHDSREGFLNFGKWYHPAAHPVQLPYKPSNGKAPATCWASLGRGQDAGPANRRAWCFQESILSRRMITYGSEQLIFECRQNVYHEDGRRWKRPPQQRNWFNLAGPSLLEQHTENSSIPFKQISTREDVLKQWYRIIRMYSDLGLYDPMDCFAAFSGLARRFQQSLAVFDEDVKPRFLAGLWESDMISGLMWRSSRVNESYSTPGPHAGLKKPSNASTVVTRAPSWSWMSLHGPITAYDASDGLQRSKCPPMPYCFPASQSGTWTPHDWGVDLVKAEDITKSLPFKLYVKGRPLRAHNAPQRSGADLVEKVQSPPTRPCYLNAAPMIRSWYSSFRRKNEEIFQKKLREEYFALNADGQQPESLGWNIAVGLFDLRNGNPPNFWALPLISDDGGPVEGLLLSETPNGAFRRLGVFWVVKPEIFRLSPERELEIE